MGLPRADTRAKRRKERSKRNAIPTGPTAGQIMGATPQAFSGYQTGAATAYGNQGGQDAQSAALGRWQQVMNGGRTAADAFAQQQAQNQFQQNSAAQRQAAVQQAQARGMGSGAGLVGSLAGSQADANAAANFGAQMAQNTQGRMDQAAQQAGALGGQMNETAFNQQFGRGQANDAFNQWAQGANAGALQQGYENDINRYQMTQAKNQSKWNKIMGVINGAVGAVGAGFGG